MVSEKLRHQRDRFVAFAFAGGDVLLEVDPAGNVRYAAGALAWLHPGGAEALVGRRFEDLVAPADREAARSFLGARGGGVSRHTQRLGLHDASGRPAKVRLSGYRLPEMADHFFLSIALADAPRAGGPKTIARDSFTARAAQRLSEAAGQDGDFALTVLELDGFESLGERTEGAGIDHLVGDLIDRLRDHSDGGDAVSRFGSDRFGVIHQRERSIAATVDRIESDSRDLDPEHRGLSVVQASLPLQPDGLSEGDAVRALVYTIDRIAGGGPLDIQTLRTSYEHMLGDTLGLIQAFRWLVHSASFEVAFQPIIWLVGRKVHHYEALARFPGISGHVSPFQLISFAEDTGLIAEFDLAMSTRVLEMIGEAGRRAPIVAVNLSTRSLSAPDFIDKLCALMERCERAPERLMFEITESYKITDMARVNDALQRLRQAGFAVCLDDFGVGASNLDYLRRLHVDYVKIDGSYIANLASTPHAKAFLTAIVQLCGQLGVKTIAECVENDQTARILEAAKVDLGQGFLFGKPESGFPGTRRAASAAAAETDKARLATVG